MKHIIQYSTWFCWLLVIPVWLQSQVLAKASVDRDRILIGEPVKLTLDVRAALGQDITWFTLDSFPHFEFLDRGKTDTTSDVDGKEFTQVLTITSFDSGRWQIPSLVLMAGNKKYSTDTINIDVAYSSFNPLEDYHDIKDITEVAQPKWLKYIPWLIGLGTLLAVGLLVYLFTRKRKTVPTERVAVSKLSPYEEAAQALQELQKKGWARDEQVKGYYSSLNDILRVFILRKLNMSTMEKTNEELISQLGRLSIDRVVFRQLSDALRIADFVKFARYQPEPSDNEKNFTVIKSAIDTLNTINIT